MQARRHIDEMNAYLRQVLEYVSQAEFEGEQLLARVEFYGSEAAAVPVETDPTSRSTAYLDWFVFDRQLTDRERTPIRRYVEHHPELPARIRDNLLGCEHSVYSTFQVAEDHADYAVVLDVLGETGDYYRVLKSAGQKLRCRELVTARLVRWDDVHCFHGAVEPWPRSPRDILGVPVGGPRERRAGARVTASLRQRREDQVFDSRRAWILDRRQRP